MLKKTTETILIKHNRYDTSQTFTASA